MSLSVCLCVHRGEYIFVYSSPVYVKSIYVYIIYQGIARFVSLLFHCVEDSPRWGTTLYA